MDQTILYQNTWDKEAEIFPNKYFELFTEFNFNVQAELHAVNNKQRKCQWQHS